MAVRPLAVSAVADFVAFRVNMWIEKIKIPIWFNEYDPYPSGT